MTQPETDQLLAAYDRLSDTTGHMLSAARAGDWERLVGLEKDCSDLIALLSRLESEDPLPEDLRVRKAAMLRKVLADDAAIRDITEPWLARLGAMLGANRREQKLLRSYGPPSGVRAAPGHRRTSTRTPSARPKTNRLARTDCRQRDLLASLRQADCSRYRRCRPTYSPACWPSPAR